MYVKRTMANYEQMLGEPVPKCDAVHVPLEPGDHPELLDDSELLPGPGIKRI